ncbi:DNA primase [Candidatus Nomurabacteria bacterium]|nr:DNA primase [Candidatus Kaiserbacteria bacterium]MCB9814177.1 DNA primase [Candidatus Nomurabacteria bacterium]
MSDSVQQIKDKLSIIDVISPYVELQKSGKNFKGKSPFSAEKTPSFYVSPDRGMYYCFSTSQGGDMFNFIQVMEGVDFKEALKILAQKAGVELVPENPQKRSERDRLYAALEATTVFCSDQLTKGSEALKYLEQRGVKSETIVKWRIGYAPGPPARGWRETKEYLESIGFKREELLKAGLIKMAESGKEPFDVFRDRVMFPMAEPNGKIVAFSGRILAKDSEAPKYVNSPETELYKKSDLLFGYDKAKQGIRNLNFSLIVEGQFDVVMCHQAGYSNTVAVSGTALTLHHVQLLERLSDKVVLALDADRAGINAMKKGAQLMLSRGLDVKVAELPLGKDPADLIQANPVDFKHVIGKSVHVIEFLLHVLRREIADDRSFKLKSREEILPFILLLPSRIDQEHFVTKVAESIGTTTDAVRYELDRLREQHRSDYARESSRAERHLDEGQKKVGKVQTDSIERAMFFLIAAATVLEESYGELIKKEVEKIRTVGELAEPSESELTGLIFSLEQQFSDLPKLAVQEEVIAKLNQFKVGLIRKKINEYRQLLETIELSGDDSGFTEALEKIKIYEILLREPAYTAEGFLGERD